MASGRILKKNITTSEKINKLSDKFALLYSWIIPFQDDFGLVWFSTDKIKWIIVPARRSLDIKSINQFKEIALRDKLFVKVVIENKEWIWFPDFTDKQTLKKDREPNTYLEGKYEWDFVDKIGEFIQKEDNGIQMEDNAYQVEKQVKLSKANISKDIYTSIDFLKNLPDDDVKELMDKYSVSKKCVLDRCEDVVNYCEAKGKKYSNYKAALRNFLKSHIEKHPDCIVVKRDAPKIPEDTRTPEEKAKDHARRDKILSEAHKMIKKL